MAWPFDGGVMEGIFGSSFSANPTMRSPAGMTPPFNPYGGAYPGGQSQQQQPQQAQPPKVGTLSPEDMGYLGGDFQYGQLPPLSEDDRLAGIIDQISIFAGTMGGQPEIVQQAQKNELFRQQKRQQAYQMDLYARIGAAKLAEEQAAEEQKTRMAMMDWLRQSADDMGQVDPELAATLAQGIMGDQDAFQQALAQLPNFDAAGVEGQKTYQKGLAEESLAQEFFPQVSQRAGDLAAATKFGSTAGEAQGIEQYGGTLADQKGRESYETKAGSEKADLDVYQQNREAYKQRAVDMQPQLGGAGKSAFSDTFLTKYDSSKQYLLKQGGTEWDKWYQANAAQGTTGLKGQADVAAAREKYVQAAGAQQLGSHAKQWAEKLIAASTTDGKELTPTRVVSILRDLDTSPIVQKYFAGKFRELAAKHGRTDVLEMLNGVFGI